MQKKEFILKIFGKLSRYWEELNDYLPLIEISSDEELEDIFVVLQTYISKLHDQKIKDKFQGALDYIKNLQEKEALEKKQEEIELENMFLDL